MKSPEHNLVKWKFWSSFFLSLFIHSYACLHIKKGGETMNRNTQRSENIKQNRHNAALFLYSMHKKKMAKTNINNHINKWCAIPEPGKKTQANVWNICLNNSLLNEIKLWEEIDSEATTNIQSLPRKEHWLTFVLQMR